MASDSGCISTSHQPSRGAVHSHHTEFSSGSPNSEEAVRTFWLTSTASAEPRLTRLAKRSFGGAKSSCARMGMLDAMRTVAADSGGQDSRENGFMVRKTAAGMGGE